MAIDDLLNQEAGFTNTIRNENRFYQTANL